VRHAGASLRGVFLPLAGLGHVLDDEGDAAVGGIGRVGLFAQALVGEAADLGHLVGTDPIGLGTSLMAFCSCSPKLGRTMFFVLLGGPRIPVWNGGVGARFHRGTASSRGEFFGNAQWRRGWRRASGAC